jgi:hypothetical protein
MPSFIAWQARLNHRQIPGVAAAPVHALQVDDCLALVSFGALAKEAATGKDAAVQVQTSSSVNIKA